jgi:hypothetical protein
MNPLIIIDFDAIRREIYEDAIESNITLIDENYIEKCFIKNLISTINTFKFKVKICYKKDISYDNSVNFYCNDALDIEYVEIKNDFDKIQLLLENKQAILIDDYDRYSEYENFEDVKYRILLLKRKWNMKNIEKYSYLIDTNDNIIYIIDIDNKLTMGLPKYISMIILKN